MKAIIENIEDFKLFRKAIPTDVVEGVTVFLIGDDNLFYMLTIEEVLRPSDMHKGFCADDGCRYGLDGLYVLNTMEEDK